eukprot:891454-Rhodomonas_salina.2
MAPVRARAGARARASILEICSLMPTASDKTAKQTIPNPVGPEWSADEAFTQERSRAKDDYSSAPQSERSTSFDAPENMIFIRIAACSCSHRTSATVPLAYSAAACRDDGFCFACRVRKTIGLWCCRGPGKIAVSVCMRKEVWGLVLRIGI